MERKGWPTWVWWALGIFALLAYWNYSDQDRRPAQPDVTSGMTNLQGGQYKDCIEHSNFYNLSDYTISEMCRTTVLKRK